MSNDVDQLREILTTLNTTVIRLQETVAVLTDRVSMMTATLNPAHGHSLETRVTLAETAITDFKDAAKEARSLRKHVTAGILGAIVAGLFGLAGVGIALLK